MGLEVVSMPHFLHDFLLVTKHHCLIVFTPWNVRQYVYYNYLFISLQRNNFLTCIKKYFSLFLKNFKVSETVWNPRVDLEVQIISFAFALMITLSRDMIMLTHYKIIIRAIKTFQCYYWDKLLWCLSTFVFQKTWNRGIQKTRTYISIFNTQKSKKRVCKTCSLTF